MNWGTDMDDKQTEDPALEALFEAGRAQTAQPSDAFLARLAADADAALPQPETAPPSAPPQVSILSRFKTLFAASGLSGAAALGVWIGFAMPDIVTTVSPLSEETTELSAFLPGADLSVFIE